MKRFTIIAGVIFSLMISMIGAPTALQAQKKPETIENPDVVIEVKGLACPFCAYGLEKKLGNLNGVQAVYIDINEGIAQLKFKSEQMASEEEIRAAIKDAGFTVQNITFASQKKAGNTQKTS